MPATELINAGVGKCWVIVQSRLERSMGNLAVALQIRNMHTGVVPLSPVHDLHLSLYHVVKMHAGAQAPTRSCLMACVRMLPLSCPDLTLCCWAWLQTNLLVLSP